MPNFNTIKNAANFDVSAIAPDSLTGYILEVDLKYPQHLHDQHTNLPTQSVRRSKGEAKFLATLYDKQRYVIYYRNLQQCTRHDLRLTKIHWVQLFVQFAWLHEYIELIHSLELVQKRFPEKFM